MNRYSPLLGGLRDENFDQSYQFPSRKNMNSKVGYQISFFSAKSCKCMINLLTLGCNVRVDCALSHVQNFAVKLPAHTRNWIHNDAKSAKLYKHWEDSSKNLSATALLILKCEKREATRITKDLFWEPSTSFTVRKFLIGYVIRVGPFMTWYVLKDF